MTTKKTLPKSKTKLVVEETDPIKPKKKAGYVRPTKVRGVDKRFRATTLRLNIITEQVLLVCAVADQKDVVQFITDLLEKYVATRPQKPRIGKLRTMAAVNNTNLETFLRSSLEQRFPQIDYNWDEITAREMLELDSEPE